MRDVDNWKIMHNSTVLGQVLTLINGRTPRKIIKQSLDGSVYVQTIGEAGHKATVSALCTRDELLTLNDRSANANAITIQYRNKKYYGYIEDMPEVNADKPGEFYTVTFDFFVDAVSTVTGGII